MKPFKRLPHNCPRCGSKNIIETTSGSLTSINRNHTTCATCGWRGEAWQMDYRDLIGQALGTLEHEIACGPPDGACEHGIERAGEPLVEIVESSVDGEPATLIRASQRMKCRGGCTSDSKWFAGQKVAAIAFIDEGVERELLELRASFGKEIPWQRGRPTMAGYLHVGIDDFVCVAYFEPLDNGQYNLMLFDGPRQRSTVHEGIERFWWKPIAAPESVSEWMLIHGNPDAPKPQGVIRAPGAYAANS